ncbi:MAG: ribonuclease P protein component [Kiritimatiellia bacterium]
MAEPTDNAPGASERMASTKRDSGKPASRFSYSNSRLPTRDYPGLFAQGQSYPGRTIVLCIRKNPAAGSPRFGVATSKRTLHEAVWRSRARRLMREAFRLNQHRLQPGTDCILVARKSIRGKPATEVAHDLLRLCRKAGILTPKK